MNVQVVDENGVTTTNILSRDATIRADEVGEVSPSVVQAVKTDNKGQMSSLTSTCGETENRREGDNKESITVEGIIRESEIDAMRSLKYAPEIQFVSDLYSGNVIVKRLSISQDTDILRFEPNSDDAELAFSFQLQLEEP